MVDLPEPRRRFGPRLILKTLLDHKYGASVCFRLYQRSVWLQWRLRHQTGLMGAFKGFRLLFRRHISNLLGRIMYIVFTTDISPFAEICPPVNATFYGLVITAGSRVCPGAYLAARVTLVNNEGLTPTIREGANLLTGCVIIGGVTVGANATVGANSVVITDVPEGTTVVGNPARAVFRRPIKI